MATEQLQATRPAVTGKWLFHSGWVLLLLGIGVYFVQSLALKQFVVPWYAPIMGTAGALAMLVATYQRWSVWRLLGLAICLALTAFEWHFLLVASRAPEYKGPEAGKQIPAFASARADGQPFTERDLAGQPTVLLFFRGHWWLACMIELGQLEKQFDDFGKRGVRIMAVSVDNREETAKMQQQFPHLIMLSDPEHSMTKAIHATHEHAGPGGSDVAAPTTLLLDNAGKVRWTYRPERVIVRQSPSELLAAVDAHLLPK